MKLSNYRCNKCGHIGIPNIVNDKEICEKCNSSNILEYDEFNNSIKEDSRDNCDKVTIALNSIKALGNSKTPVSLMIINSLEEAVKEINETRIKHQCSTLFSEIKENNQNKIFDYILKTFKITSMGFDRISDDETWADALMLDGSIEIGISNMLGDFRHSLMRHTYSNTICTDPEDFTKLLENNMENPDDALLESFTIDDFDEFQTYISTLLSEASQQELFITTEH